MYQCRLSIALAHRQLAEGVGQGCIHTRPGCKAACLLFSQHHQETALQAPRTHKTTCSCTGSLSLSECSGQVQIMSMGIGCLDDLYVTSPIFLWGASPFPATLRPSGQAVGAAHRVVILLDVAYSCAECKSPRQPPSYALRCVLESQCLNTRCF